MMPNKILIMRHTEKPEVHDDIHLTSAGIARAQQLMTYIPSTVGNPQFLFAAAESKDSNRPMATIQPLSQAINVGLIAHLVITITGT
jgi:broad specificity phosphatase PhoE